MRFSGHTWFTERWKFGLQETQSWETRAKCHPIRESSLCCCCGEHNWWVMERNRSRQGSRSGFCEERRKGIFKKGMNRAPLINKMATSTRKFDTSKKPFMLAFSLLCASSALASAGSIPRSRIRMEPDGGYTKIVVKISKDVPEKQCPTLLRNLKVRIYNCHPFYTQCSQLCFWEERPNWILNKGIVTAPLINKNISTEILYMMNFCITSQAH